MLQEIRSKNKRRNGWYLWSALQSIPEWTADVNHMREPDKPGGLFI